MEQQQKTGRRESRRDIYSVTTLKVGAIDQVREALEGPEAAQIEAKYGRAYYRDKNGSLRRLFPKGEK